MDPPAHLITALTGPRVLPPALLPPAPDNSDHCTALLGLGYSLWASLALYGPVQILKIRFLIHSLIHLYLSHYQVVSLGLKTP